MKTIQDVCKLALVQAEPVLFDKAACVAKALRLIREAAAQKADLIVFPELFIPGYPIGMNFGFSMGKRTEPGRADWKRYYDASVVVGDADFLQLAQAAKDANAYVSIGFSERDAVIGTLYNSNVIFEPDGSWKVHRKLKPTGSERLVWGDANRNYFPVTETPWGPMAGLICWESYMPLARVALYQKGVTIYLSPNTNDNPEWQATIQHIAIEGKCFFVNADMLVRRSSYPRRPEALRRRGEAARHGLPRRQLRHRSLRALPDGTRVGRGGRHLRRAGHAARGGLQNGARPCRPLRQARRAGADRTRKIRLCQGGRSAYDCLSRMRSRAPL